MAIRLAVGPQTLNLVAQVRILDRQPESAPSSSGLGHHPLKVAARVRIPLGVRTVLAALYALSKIAALVEMLLHYDLRINEKLMNSLCSNF